MLDDIERQLDVLLKDLARRQANPNNIVNFDSYKGLFDTIIALKRAQASEKQNELLLRIAIGIECLESTR